jgi:hypothetical protein
LLKFVNSFVLLITDVYLYQQTNKQSEIMKANFENFKLGTKVQSYDKDGYYVMKASGYVEKHLGEGHAIIKDFNGVCWSTVGLNNIAEVEILN